MPHRFGERYRIHGRYEAVIEITLWQSYHSVIFWYYVRVSSSLGIKVSQKVPRLEVALS